ncbi:hypothetical protein NG798_24560 [Ancylothrix sp. C2]|uniref:hypothetical protein n=1 Tax=Ancylothrix sp. D3o TaxID=2953691 RepID=UPI0021BAC2FA|nr:hypothetical protein [Ancylothrix sp. D3o]MCT7952975.1 hypothetical protein [Ancylothrix sp. D3o]
MKHYIDTPISAVAPLDVQGPVNLAVLVDIRKPVECLGASESRQALERKEAGVMLGNA